MHEMSICQALMDQVERIATEQGAKQVDSIVLSIGPLSGVEPDLLSRAFEIARLQTVAENALLEISKAISSDRYLDDILRLIVTVTANAMDSKICSHRAANESREASLHLRRRVLFQRGENPSALRRTWKWPPSPFIV